MSKDRQDLARYLLQHSADDNAPLSQEAQAWAEKEVVRILQAEKEAYEAREDAIANALGLPDSWKARSDFPILNAIRIQRERIARLEAALAWYADKANYITDVTPVRDGVQMYTIIETDGGERARKALGEGK